MSGKLTGGRELRARLKAARLMFKPYGLLWAETTADEARRRVPSRTGRLRRSIRKKNATQRRATVVGHFTGNFVDAGSEAHDIVAKNAPRLIFQDRGRTIFTRKVHKQRIAGRPFKRPSAEAAFRRHPMSDTLIREWNRAA
mgnify:CR=1 FL=1